MDPPEGYHAHRRERLPFRVTRTFKVPARIDPERVSVTLRDGVLTLRLEKSEEAKPRVVPITTD